MKNKNRIRVQHRADEVFLGGEVIRFISSSLPNCPKPGTLGTIEFVDEDNRIYVNWEDGSDFVLKWNMDVFQYVGNKEQ